MLQRPLIAALSVLMAAASWATADDQPKPPTEAAAPVKSSLVWKFTKGTTFYQTMTTTTKQTMKVLNNDVTQTQTQTFYFSWAPIEQKGDDWIVSQKIVGVKMDIDLGGSKISYDSTKTDNPKNALSDFFTALKDTEFKLTINVPKDKPITVTNVEGRQAFLDKLTTANQPMKPLLDQILSDDSLKQMATPTFAALANKEATKDKDKADSWPATSTLDMGPIGKYVNTFTYTYDGKFAAGANDAEKKWDVIKATTKLTYTPPPVTAQSGGLPFQIKSADLTSKDATGTIYYDPDKGRITRSEMNLKLTGDLSIEIGGQTTPVHLDQDQNTKVETSDKDPTKPG
jgi:hypothetical protein